MNCTQALQHKRVEWIKTSLSLSDEFDDELIDVISRGKLLSIWIFPFSISTMIYSPREQARGRGHQGAFHEIAEKIPGVVLRTSLIVGSGEEG